MGSKIFMSYVVPLSILLPIFIGLIRFKYLSYSAKIILGYLFLAGIINALAAYIGRVLHKNTMPLVHILTVLEIVFFSIFFKHVLGIKKNEVGIFNLIVATFVLFCLTNVVFFQNIYTYNSYARSIEALLVMFFSIKYFAKISAEVLDRVNFSRYTLLFVIGLFLYFSGALMLFIFSNLTIVQMSKDNFNVIWTLHAALVLLMYLLFSIGFIYAKSN